WRRARRRRGRRRGCSRRWWRSAAAARRRASEETERRSWRRRIPCRRSAAVSRPAGSPFAVALTGRPPLLPDGVPVSVSQVLDLMRSDRAGTDLAATGVFAAPPRGIPRNARTRLTAARHPGRCAVPADAARLEDAADVGARARTGDRPGAVDEPAARER